MDDTQASSSRRPAKRVHQACEGCRRKKARCPGEKPQCSSCVRLGQQCTYADDSYTSEKADLERRMDQRLAEMESRINAFMRFNQELSPRPSLQDDIYARDQAPAVSHLAPSRTSALSSRGSLSANRTSYHLPRQDVLARITHLFLKYCNHQPIPLFHPDLKSNFMTRDDELLFAIIAFTSRTSAAENEHHRYNHEEYIKLAQDGAMARISAGSVKLSTLQCLVLLSFLDFHLGGTQRCYLYLQNATILAKLSGLEDTTAAIDDPIIIEERRRCASSIWILERMYGSFDLRTAPKQLHEYPGLLPASPGITTGGSLLPHGEHDADTSLNTGIVASQMPLWSTWAKTMSYLERAPTKLSAVPLWSCESEYASIVSGLLEIESMYPLKHRYHGARPDQCSMSAIEEDWAYWGTWLHTQIMYHTILTILNHPDVVSIYLRPNQHYPPTFTQATVDLVRLHSNWIIRLLDELGGLRGDLITSPFIGYCVVVAATVFLHFSSSEDNTISQLAVTNLTKSLAILEKLSTHWPRIEHMVTLLQELKNSGSTDHLNESTSGCTAYGHTKRQQLVGQLITYDSGDLASQGKDLFCGSLHVGSRSRPGPVDNSINPNAQPLYGGRLDDLVHGTQTGNNQYAVFPASGEAATPRSQQSGHGPTTIDDLLGLHPSTEFSQWSDFGPL